MTTSAASAVRLTFVNGNEVQVHAATCADLSRPAVRRDAQMGGSFTQSFPAGSDQRDAWMDYNADFLEEGGADAAWELDFKPCCAKAGLAANADRSWGE